MLKNNFEPLHCLMFPSKMTPYKDNQQLDDNQINYYTLASVGCSLIKFTNSEHQSLVSVIGSSINQ